MRFPEGDPQVFRGSTGIGEAGGGLPSAPGAPGDYDLRISQTGQASWQENSVVNTPATFSADQIDFDVVRVCLLYTSPSPRDATLSRMPSSA